VLRLDVTNVTDDVAAAVAAYDEALRAGDLDAVDTWFLPGAATSRFAVDGVAYGFAAISAARKGGTPPTDRVDDRHELVPLGDDVVVATLEHHRPGWPERRGRRTQVWWRTDAGWRIAHAHLSVEP
jgi:ketosteroid isomerase-like protein